MFKLRNTDGIIRLSDGANLPVIFKDGKLQEFDEHSPFVKELRSWIAAGNVPEPADPVVVPPAPKSLVDELIDHPDFPRLKGELRKP